MFKIMNKMNKCDRYNRSKIILNQVRGHCFKYFKQNYEAIIQRKFFLQQNCKYLESIVGATSVNSFKAGIDHWMSSEISCHSVPDNTLTGLASTA